MTPKRPKTPTAPTPPPFTHPTAARPTPPEAKRVPTAPCRCCGAPVEPGATCPTDGTVAE